MNTYIREIQINTNVISNALDQLVFNKESLTRKKIEEYQASVDKCINLIINIHVAFLDKTVYEDKSISIIFTLCEKLMEHNLYHLVAKLIFLFHGIRYDILNEFILKNLK